jgi:hypothetical protein
VESAYNAKHILVHMQTEVGVMRPTTRSRAWAGRVLVLAIRALAVAGLVAAVALSGQPAIEAQSVNATLPRVPAGWPSASLELGMSDGPGGAAALRQIAPFGFRYQYLAGGVNTGQGWATWNPDGSFVSNYIKESVDNQVTPVFTYYMIRQSAPGKDMKEADGVNANLQNASTMAAYFQDLELFFQRAAAFNRPVVLHVEPDMWGYLEQRTQGGDASTVSVQVAGSGVAEVAGLPDTAAGFAQAVVKLRDTYAPNVLLGYHLSTWGTGTDILFNKPSDERVRELGLQGASYYQSLGANFDLVFHEFSDRDAAFKQYQYRDNGKSWWKQDDFNRNLLFLSTFVDSVQKRVVLWQIPFGNTRMRAMNNTWDHYQDNKVEWLLDDPSGANLDAYMRAGVIAFLFGRGADGATCACDAAKDGVTDPDPINGNDVPSVNADDDGGFFRQKAQAYYANGPLPLYDAGSPTPSERGAGSVAVVPAAAAQPASSDLNVVAHFDKASVKVGETATVTASVSSGAATTALVDLEVYDQKGTKVFQKFFDGQALPAGQVKEFSASWTPSVTVTGGTYMAKVGIFAPNWGAVYAWNDKAADISVTNPSPPNLSSSVSLTPGPSVVAGNQVSVTATIGSATALAVLVDVEIYDGRGGKVFQKAFDNQNLAAGSSTDFSAAWTAPSTPGAYTVKVGLFSPGWGTLYTWNDSAASITVSAGDA